MVELTVAHWVYAIFIILVLVTMAMRRETPLVCIIGSFILSWVITGNLVKAVQAVFNAITVAFSELLGVVVIISMIVAMAKMLEETGSGGDDVPTGPGNDQISRDRLLGDGIRHHDRGLGDLAFSGHCPGGRIASAGGDQGRPSSDQCGHGDQHVRIWLRPHHGLHHPGCTRALRPKPPVIAVGDVMAKSLPMLIVWGIIALPLSFIAGPEGCSGQCGKTHRVGAL